MAGMFEYQSYLELKKIEVEGKDYCISYREGKTGIVVMAPHAGDIEPASGELADAVAGNEHSFYAFWGLKDKNNASLHISSTRFDEPIGVDLAQKSKTTLTIHGSKETRKMVYVGGRDKKLKRIIQTALRGIEIPTGESSRLQGIKPENICNRSRSGQGVQLEISAGLRQEFYGGGGATLNKNNRNFVKLVKVLRDALASLSFRA
jgi:phage replication-related protein YjqB (UPF0714/DUF867 family)